MEGYSIKFTDDFGQAVRSILPGLRATPIDKHNAMNIAGIVLKKLLEGSHGRVWVAVNPVHGAGFDVIAGLGENLSYPRWYLRLRSGGEFMPVRIVLNAENDTGPFPRIVYGNTVPVPEDAGDAARAALASLSAEKSTARIEPQLRIRLIEKVSATLKRMGERARAMSAEVWQAHTDLVPDEKYDPLKGKIRCDVMRFRPRENISAWELACIIEKARPFAVEQTPGEPFAISDAVHRKLPHEVARHFRRCSAMVSEIG